MRRNSLRPVFPLYRTDGTGRSVNWAVLTLLGVTGGVLSGFIGFFVHLLKRSRQALGNDAAFVETAARRGEPGGNRRWVNYWDCRSRRRCLASPARELTLAIRVSWHAALPRHAGPLDGCARNIPDEVPLKSGDPDGAAVDE